MLLSLGAIVELALRLTWDEQQASPQLQRRKGLLRLSADPDVGYELIPGAEGRCWGIQVSVNRLGFRDRERRVEKPPSEFRVLALGDSITFGVGLGPAELWPRMLESQLADRDVSVWNLALSGYDTLHEAALLERRGLDLEPDLVLVGYCINDIGLHSIDLELLELGAREHGDHPLYIVRYLGRRLAHGGEVATARLANQDGPFTVRYEDRIADISGDGELERLRGELADIIDRGDMKGRHHSFAREYASAVHLGRLRFAFEWLARLSEERGLPVVVVPIPFLTDGEHTDAYQLCGEIVEHEVRHAGLAWWPLRNAFADREFAALRFTPADWAHFNAEGHLLIATELAAQLRRHQGW